MKAGIAASRGELILVAVADEADDPRAIERMVRQAGLGADLVAASRYAPGGGETGGSRRRRWLSRAGGLTLHWLAGVPIHDATGTYTLYSRDFLDSVTMESESAPELALELAVKATIAGRMMAEVPSTRREPPAEALPVARRALPPRYLHWFLVAARWRLRRLGAWR